MKNPYLIGAVVLAIICIYISLARKGRRGERPAGERLPYRRNMYFLSAAEQSFFRILKGVAAGRYEVFAKVRISDLLYVPGREEEWQSYWNKIQSKHVDFVLCDPQNLLPAVVIELDDSSHRQPARRDRDAFVDRAMNGAGLPILHVLARASYSPAELATQLEQVMAGPPAAAASPAASPAANPRRR